jgi:hypothetical protein
VPPPQPLDFEAVSSYTVVVQISDGEFSDTGFVTVDVSPAR